MLTWLLLLGLQPVLAWTVCRLARGQRRLALALMLGAGGLILLKAVIGGRPAWEAALFPFADYVIYQGFVLYFGAALFFGACLSYLGTRLERQVFAGLFAIVVVQSGWANFWLADPTVYGADVYADAQCHCRQTTSYTCGPAACVSALAHCGLRKSERQLAALCLTNRTGTNIFNVYRGVTLALAGSAYQARLHEPPAEALANKGVVAVLCLPGHAVAVVGDGDTVIVHDPLQAGPSRWNLGELRTNYPGAAVILQRRD